MMQPSEIQALAQQELRDALGDASVAKIDVTIKTEDNGSEYLDITVHYALGRGLPKAVQSIDASRRLRHSLAARGETRFPNVVFVSAADAA